MMVVTSKESCIVDPVCRRPPFRIRPGCKQAECPVPKRRRPAHMGSLGRVTSTRRETSRAASNLVAPGEP